MKKIIRGIFLTLFVLLVVFVARYLTYNPDVEDAPIAKPVVTDAAGTTYLVVKDDSGTTYAVVTDDQGNRYAAEYDGSQVGSTVGKINDQIKLEDIPKNTKPNGEAFEATANGNAYQGSVSYESTKVNSTTIPGTTVPNATRPGDGNESTTSSSSQSSPGKEDPFALTPYRIKKYTEVFTGNKYLMEFTTNDEDLSGNITVAIKDGKSYIKTSMSLEQAGEEVPIIMITDDDDEGNTVIYVLFENFKKYSKLTEEMIGEDLSMADMMSEFDVPELSNISVSEVSINGQKLILESFINADGNTCNYYFDGDVLVRKDTVFSNGTVDSVFFSKITTDVPDSLFEIPEGYGYLNLSWLGAFMK